MDNRLIITSKPLLIDIQNYRQGHSVIQGYKLTDVYEPKNGIHHGQFRLVIESPIIRADGDLSIALKKSYSLANTITLILKCILGEAVNTSPFYFQSFTMQANSFKNMPQGWTSNRDAVQKELDKTKRIIVNVEPIFEHYVEMSISPFDDIAKAVKGYPKLSNSLKELLQLINESDLVSKNSRYLLLGKALEIVNSLYPFNHSRKDSRINDVFPELEAVFEGISLKKLLEWANTRQEARHYVNKQLTPHPQMTDDERKRYYECTNLFCINVIRRALGLDIVSFTR